MTRRNWNCQVVHVYREANQAAHLLATMGQFHTWGLKIIQERPHELCNVLCKDVNVRTV